MTQLNDASKPFRKAYIKMQAELPPIEEAADGQEGNRKFKYAPLDQIMPEVQPVLTSHHFGICHQIKAGTLYSTLLHEEGELVSEIDLGFGENWKQNGAAITYARRYNVLTLLNLTPTGEDTMEQMGNVKRNAEQTKKKEDTTKKTETSFIISHVDENGVVSEVTYPRTAKGIKEMIEPFEDSMAHDPQIWFANRDTILDVYNVGKTKGIEVNSPGMGPLPFGEWCETLNNRMQDKEAS